MLVELTGSTGAGKSTLTAQLLAALQASGYRALTAEQFVLRHFGLPLDRLTWRPALSLLLDLLAFPSFLRFALRHRQLGRLMLTVVWRDAQPLAFKLNVLRNIAKHMGTTELLRRHGHTGEIVLLDEGLVHQAHSLFVHPNAEPRPVEVARFVADVPLPDLLVLVEAQRSDLVERTLRRGHPRVPRASAAEMTRFIDRAQRVLRSVVEQAAQRTSTEVLWNDAAAAHQLRCTILRRLQQLEVRPVEPPLNLVRWLFEELDRHQVRYCHWKSNAALGRALAGEGDLDILVDPACWTSLTGVLDELGFVPAHLPSWKSRQGAHHYYGMDASTGRFVHVDLYDRLLTGGTLLKNHVLPLEEMVFSSLRREAGVAVPSRGAELVLLVVRKLLECASIPEYALLLREYSGIRRELRWLADEQTRAEARALVRQWLPDVPVRLFCDCLLALESPRAVVRRIALGRDLARRLARFERHAARDAEARRWGLLGRWLVQRLRGPSAMALDGPGAIVAYVGPEASGKSTLASDTRAWLAEAFVVRSMHAGKPPPSPFTVLPNLLAPKLRKVLPEYRTTAAELGSVADPSGKRSLGTWLYRLRCVGLAYDRRRLLKSAERLRSQGAVVVCDRYPTAQLGFVDGAQLDERAASGLLETRLARLEKQLYRSIPRPDLVVVCQVPLGEALRRNRSRRKQDGPEPDEFVRRRHAQFASNLPLEFRQHLIDTTLPPAEVRQVVRRLIWQTLSGRAARTGAAR
jgi:thymidylate kinase